MQGAQRMNLQDFGGPLTFYVMMQSSHIHGETTTSSILDPFKEIHGSQMMHPKDP